MFMSGKQSQSDAAAAAPAAGPDWKAIEAEVRESDSTLQAIARKHGIGYDALCKRARRGLWRPIPDSFAHVRRVRPAREPDPDPPAREAIPLHRALVAYVNTRHAPGSDGAYNERAILEGAALQLEMIRQHRGDIRGARELALTLLGQLEAVAGHREAILAALNELEEPGARRQAMARAVALPTHIAAMRDLSTTLRQLIPLERQALGIPDMQPLEPLGPRDPTDHVAQRIDLAQLEEAIDRQLAKAKANGSQPH